MIFDMKKFHSLQKCLLISYIAHPKLYSKTAMEESFVFFKFINDCQYEEVSEYTKCLNLTSVMSDFMENNNNNRPHCMPARGWWAGSEKPEALCQHKLTQGISTHRHFKFYLLHFKKNDKP